MPPESPRRSSDGSLLAAVTKEIVRLHATHYGKGPTRARSYFVGDSLICQMEDTVESVEVV